MYRILHISDVHFGPPHLQKVSEAILRLILERTPNLVVVSGDLTQRAKPGQFRQAREFVDRIPVPVIVVPGNHDVPMYRCWERTLSPFGAYRKYFDRNLEPVFGDSEVYVVGVNTAFGWTIENGRFTDRRLKEVEELLQEAPLESCKIVVAHHPPIRPPELSKKSVAINAERALEIFSRFGVELLLSGHLHRSVVESSRHAYPKIIPELVIALSGTTTSSRGRGREEGRNSCNWIEVTKKEITVSTLRWQQHEQSFLADPEVRFSRKLTA